MGPDAACVAGEEAAHNQREPNGACTRGEAVTSASKSDHVTSYLLCVLSKYNVGRVELLLD